MKIQKFCENCKNEFTAIKVTQKFCCRKCFKQDYYLRQQKRIKEELANPVYPIKICPFCEDKFELNFDPIKFPKLFDSMRCPSCNIANELIWKNIEEPNSRQVIQRQLLASLRTSKQRTVTIESTFVFEQFTFLPSLSPIRQRIEESLLPEGVYLVFAPTVSSF